jgi:hypothetical protein
VPINNTKENSFRVIHPPSSEMLQFTSLKPGSHSGESIPMMDCEPTREGIRVSHQALNACHLSVPVIHSLLSHYRESQHNTKKIISDV